MKPEILQIAPMLPQRRGGARRRLRRCTATGRRPTARRSSPRPARASAAWRPTATTASRREIMAALPKLEIVASYGVGYDNIDTAACKARGVRVTNTPDVLNDAVAELTLGLMLGALPAHPAGRRLRPRGPLAERQLRPDRRADRRARRHPRPRPDRQGDRPPPAGDEDARLLPRPPRAALRALRLLSRPRGDGARRRLAGGDRARLGRDARHRLAPRCSRRSAPRARSSTSRAARWSTSRRWSSSSPTAASAAPRSTSSPTSRACRRRCSRLPNVVLSPHQGSATRKTRAAMGDLVVRNLAAHFAGDPLLTPIA